MFEEMLFNLFDRKEKEIELRKEVDWWFWLCVADIALWFGLGYFMGSL